MLRPGSWRREFAVPIQTIQSELNRLIEEYWQSPGGSGPGAEPTDLATAVWTPAIDLVETSSEMILTVDLPGVDPGSIDLSLTGNVLSIRGEKAATDPAGGHPRAKERPSGTFRRQVTLTEAVDFDRVQAQAKDGVLIVRLPKQETARARTITIQAQPTATPA